MNGFLNIWRCLHSHSTLIPCLSISRLELDCSLSEKSFSCIPVIMLGLKLRLATPMAVTWPTTGPELSDGQARSLQPKQLRVERSKNPKGVLGVQRVGQNFAHQNHYTLATIQPNLNCKIKSKAATATLSIKTPPWSSIERSTYSVSHWSILCLSRSRRGMQIH